MSFFLALDAGGTKTDYALADERRVLARVRSGTIKRMRTDVETAQRNLDGALAELSALTGVAMQSIQRTCVGTAGETVPLVARWLREALAARVGGELLLVGDVEIALDAAFPGAPGILVLAGTGSNVAGRAETGEISTAGGWGPLLADQGSGHRIGHEGLRTALLAKDEGRSTRLLEAVMEFWNLASIEEMVEFGNSEPAPDFSRLTEVVQRCAELGDEVAVQVLREQGKELAYLVRLMIRRLKRTSTEEEWLPPVAFAGSIMEKIPLVRKSLMAAVRREFPKIRAVAGVVDPIEGAVARSRVAKL